MFQWSWDALSMERYSLHKFGGSLKSYYRWAAMRFLLETQLEKEL